MTFSVVRMLALVMLPCVTGAASFTPIGAASPEDVSNGGTVLVGAAGRWTASDGWVGVGGPVRAVSDNGAVVVGMQFGSGNTRQAFRWTSATGLVGLGDLPGNVYRSDAFGVSGDGSVVVGQGYSSSGLEAFRWTSAGMIALGDLGGGDFKSVARDVSADGSVVVGYGSSSAGEEAMRWTTDGGMLGLGDFTGGYYWSGSTGVSADGSVVVGFGSDSVGSVAFRWTQSDGMVALRVPGWVTSAATDVSGDGTKIVGYATGGPPNYRNMAFLWTADRGIESLLDVLISYGATGLDGWLLGSVSAISADGNWVVGTGVNPDGRTESFLANISPIPIPAAVWLFASSLGIVGLLRRRVELATSS